MDGKRSFRFANSGSTYTLNVTENSTVAVTFKAMVPVSAVRNGRNGNIAITANGKDDHGRLCFLRFRT